MAASNSKGVTIQIAKPTATGVTITPTAVSSAKPAVVSTADTTGLVEGQLIKVPAGATGYPEIDGKFFTVGTIVADTTVVLNGSDTTGSAGVFATTADLVAYPAADMETLCLSSISFNPDTPETVSVGTFCDPSASISSASASAGTVDISGYVDITASDYGAMLAWYDDGQPRQVLISMPNNGAITFPMTLSSLNWDIPIDGALTWNGSGSLGSRPQHLF